jgi:hypothetical protein
MSEAEIYQASVTWNESYTALVEATDIMLAEPIGADALRVETLEELVENTCEVCNERCPHRPLNPLEEGEPKMTNEDQLNTETRRALDELHDRLRLGSGNFDLHFGEVARAIEAGLVALAEGSALAGLHRKALAEWVSNVLAMVLVCDRSPYTSSGRVERDRWIRWRDAVETLLQAIDAKCPAATPGFVEQFLASLTPQQAERIARPLSEQQKDLLQDLLQQHFLQQELSKALFGWLGDGYKP